METDIDLHNTWSGKKIELNLKDISNIFFDEREVWWCHCGINVGYEQDGKNENFERPVIVIKKINKDLFIGVPTTTKNKKRPYQFYVGPGEIKDKSGQKIEEENYAIWNQIKTYSSRRLIRKVKMIDKQYFDQLKAIIKDFI